MFMSFKNTLIVVFCVFHMTAIAWWTLPLSLNNNNPLTHLLSAYIDLTGNQQYWDFFAPQSPKYHQYLSVCNSLDTDKTTGEINCAGTALFSNLKHNDEPYSVFSNTSRYYRLTETLINQNNPDLFKAFAQYYSTHQADTVTHPSATQLVGHQYELYPDLKDLPHAGYRTDTILWESQ